jgi:hypothetical protein
MPKTSSLCDYATGRWSVLSSVVWELGGARGHGPWSVGTFLVIFYLEKNVVSKFSLGR